MVTFECNDERLECKLTCVDVAEMSVKSLFKKCNVCSTDSAVLEFLTKECDEIGALTVRKKSWILLSACARASLEGARRE